MNLSSFYPLLAARCGLAKLLRMALCVTPFMGCTSAYATQWQLLKATHGSQLMIDKQSIIEQAPYTKAWVKMEYREPQKNLESVDRVYTHARALWYFDCATRKAATLQVFQYDADALVYSAGIEVKQAEFVEPLPESEVEIAQQYVCQKRVSAQAAAKQKTAAPQGSKAEQADGKAKANTTTPSASTASAPAVSPQPAANLTKPDTSAASANPATAKKDKPPAKTTPSQAKAGAEAAASGKTTPEKKSEASNALNWQYEGAQGPGHWAELSPDYLSCGHGQQQSPIAIEQTIPAALKPLKALQKFPLKSISNDGHGLRLDAGSGNMMVLDQQPYQMKTISLHFPAEHLIRQKRYAGELQMLHEDKQGHRVMLTVMIEEGRSHPALEKLLGQLPKAGDAAKMLALRITPAELMPEKTAYYRYSGSLTTPPCSEGVQWVVMKKPIQASPAQLVSLQQASHGQNQRPLQDHQGRMVLE